MNRIILALPLAILVLAAAALAVAAAPAESAAPPAVAEARPAPADASEAAPRSAIGPIRSKDPAVRAAITELYLERQRREDAAYARLDEIRAALAGENSPAVYQELMRELTAAKKAMELENVRIGLEIAQLDGDTRRAEDFARALDQLENPEAYFPAPQPDRERTMARLRELGIEAEVSR